MDALRLDGHFCFKVHGSEFMMAGLPDIICCAGGLFIGLETKNPDGGDPTPVQKLRHEQIKAAGGTAVPVRSVAQARSAVRAALASKAAAG